MLLDDREEPREERQRANMQANTTRMDQPTLPAYITNGRHECKSKAKELKEKVST